jgi:hypothetical protein
MLRIVWNRNGFHLINVLSKAIKFKTTHDVTDILVPLLERCKTQVGGKDRELIVHVDDARGHTARVTL